MAVLKIENMIDEYEKKKRKQIAGMRSIMDYGIGTLIACFGIFLFFRSKLNIPFNENFPPNEIDKLFGVVCVIYGSWRIYRGYKKKYFK